MSAADRRLDRGVPHAGDLLVPLQGQPGLQGLRGDLRRGLGRLLVREPLLAEHLAEAGPEPAGRVREAAPPAGGWDYRCIYLIAAILGVMMLMRLLPKGGWISRWPLAFIVGRRRDSTSSPIFSRTRSTRSTTRSCRWSAAGSGVPSGLPLPFRVDWDAIFIFVGTVTGLDLLLLLRRAQAGGRRGRADRHLLPDGDLRRLVRLHRDEPDVALDRADGLPLRRLARPVALTGGGERAHRHPTKRSAPCRDSERAGRPACPPRFESRSPGRGAPRADYFSRVIFFVSR